MSTPKLHNKPLSIDHRPSNGASAQEAVDPSPGPDPAPDARGPAPRKNPRGPAPQGALLQAPDACGNLPQKKTRTPAPARQERSRRGRPYPQNRDGSGKAGLAEGSLPRLAPEGQDIEQEIALLRSLANRLLSRRRINYPYLFRCLNLIARCTTVKARYFNNESDEEVDKIAAGMRRFWESTMADRIIGYRELLPMIMASPGKDLTRYDNLLPIHPELLDSLLEVKDAWEREHGSPFVDNPTDEEEPPPFGMRPLPPHLYQPPDDDPPLSPSVIPDSDRESIPAPLPIPMPREESDAPTPEPTPSLPTHTLPSVVPVEDRACPCEGGGTHPHTPTQAALDPPPSFTPIGAGAPNYWETDSFSSPIDATGGSPEWPDPSPPPNPKPRIARGRPPP